MKRYVLMFLSMFVAGHAPAQIAKPATKPLPIEDFSRFDEYGAMKISPTGEYIAYMTGRYGRETLAVLSLKERKVIGGLKSPEGFEVYDFNWVSPTRYIYRIAQRVDGLSLTAPTPTGEMFAADVDAKKQVFIYGLRAGESSTGTHMQTRESSRGIAQLVSELKKDDRYVLIAEYPWREGASYLFFDRDAKPTLYKLDVFDGKKTRVGAVPISGAHVLVDHNDEPRFAIGHTEKDEVAVSWKPEPTSDWTAFELPGFREESIEPIIFGEDNQSVFFVGLRSGDKFSALYKLDLKSHDVVKVFAIDNSGIEDVVLDFQRNRIIGVIGSDGNRRWLDSQDRVTKTFIALEKAFPNDSLSILSASADGRTALMRISSDVNPGDYYLVDTDARKADYLRPARKWIDPNQMRHKIPFAFKARDGLELHGFITRPLGEGPYPLVVLPHGGPHGIRDYRDFDEEVQLLANRGFAVLQVNFRGSGGYGMDFERAGYLEWGGKMQDDVTDATHWAIDQKIAAPDRICIYGASYGGYAALMGAVREPSLYRCAIGFAGVYDLELMFSSADVPTSKSGKAYLEKVLGTDREQLRARSPANNAQAITAPVLLIHGKEDGRADFAQAKRMKAALEKSNKKFEWMALSGEGHGVYDEKTRAQVYQKIVGFLEQNLMQGR